MVAAMLMPPLTTPRAPDAMEVAAWMRRPMEEAIVAGLPKEANMLATVMAIVMASIAIWAALLASFRLIDGSIAWKTSATAPINLFMMLGFSSMATVAAADATATPAATTAPTPTPQDRTAQTVAAARAATATARAA